MKASQQKQPATAANDVESLYKEAIDPSTSGSRLKEIWGETKSVRVRKAIASNPNCNSAIMREAARLYIREVIGNTSFELLNLFSEDKEIKEIYDSYMDPQSNNPVSLMKMREKKRSLIARSMLVSPHLKSQFVLSDVCSALSSAEFKREMKDDQVRDNIVSIVKNGIKDFKVPVLLFLFNNGVIDMSDMEVALEGKVKSSVVTSKGNYLKFLTSCIEQEVSGVDRYDLIMDFMRVHRPINTHDLTKKVREKESLRTDEHIKLYAKMYRDFLKNDVSETRAQYSMNKNRYGYSPVYTLSEDSHSYEMSNLIWTAISMRSMTCSTLEDLDLNEIYSVVKLAGFHEDFGPFKCQLKLPHTKLLSGRNMICTKLLEIEDDREFEFFMTSDILWSEWYARGHGDNLEKRVVDRMDRINQRVFDEGGKVYYNSSCLDFFPTIQISQRHGLSYDPSKYAIRV